MATSSADPSGTAPALAGPFTLREVVVMGGALLLLVGSVLPFQVGGGSYANVWTFHTTAFNQFISLALPLVIGVAFAWRRLAGRTHVTAGSLTLDQLASVVSLLGILYFFISSVMSMNPAFLLGLLGALVMAGGTTAAPYIPGFVLDFVPGEAALLTRPILPSAPRAPRAPRESAASEPSPAAGPASAHTAAPGHPHTAGDTSVANPAADADQPVVPSVATGLSATHSTTPEPTPGAWPRPGATQESAEQPTAEPVVEPAEQPLDQATAESTADASGSSVVEPAVVPDASPDAAAEAPAPETTLGTTVEPGVGSTAGAEPTGSGQDAAAPEEHSFSATSAGQDGPAHQAFWFAVPERRTAVHEATGRNAFVLEPGEWILALEDRGYEFLVQDTDGSVGVLRDLGRIERA